MSQHAGQPAGLAPSSVSVDVSALIERQKLTPFLLRLLGLLILLMMVDGYDGATISYAAPRLIRAFHVDRSAFGPVFSMGVLGSMFGSFLFGMLGDVVGRKPAITACCVAFGVFTLLTVFATGVGQLAWLRLLDGLALGGLMPLAFVLAIESVPKGYRATVFAVIGVGSPIGSSLCGWLSAGLVGHYGWPLLFWMGGLAALSLAALVLFGLPESLSFLAVKGRRPQVAARLARRIAPEVEIKANSRFFASGDQRRSGARQGVAGFGELLHGRLGVMSLLLWAGFICSSIVLFLLGSWMPVLAEGSGLSPSSAALASSMIPIGGTVGNLAMMRFIDRHGVIAATTMPLLAGPLVATLGFIGYSGAAFMAAMFALGFFVQSGHAGLGLAGSLIYPTSVRTLGSGWTFSIGKIGGIAGPLIGGALLARHLPVTEIFLIAAAPYLVVTPCLFVLGLMHGRAMREEALAMKAPNA